MKFSHLLGCVLFVALLPFSLSAQTEPVKVKFGKVSQEDLVLTEAPGDSTARAYVLFNSHQLRMNYDQSTGTKLQEDHHRRVKLLTEASFDMADIELTYYRDSERLQSVKAQIHYPDGSSVKLKRGDMIREQYDENYDVLKFTFPGVRQGAIIEYSWTRMRENILVPRRYFFQEDIPVRYAEYQAYIPEYFDYVSLSSGLNKYDYERVDKVSMTFAKTMTPHAAIHWVMTDLPALEQQPYVNNFSDYIPQVRMQLRSVSIPNQPVDYVMNNWQKTTEKIDNWLEFGRAYRLKSNSNKVYKAVAPLLAGASTETEQAQRIYDFVTGKITWDGDFTWTAEDTPNKVFEAATGSSGEMSILLLALLRQHGITAQPVLVPLRNYGSPIEIYPLLTQFDHLMVLATLDGNEILLDPNSVFRPMGLPRRAALNHRAFVADPANPHWIDVDGGKASQTVLVEMVIDEEGMAEVDLQSKLASYYAVGARSSLNRLEDDNEFPLMEDILGIFPDATLVDKEVKDDGSKSGPLNFNMHLKVPVGQSLDDFLYVQPILCPVLEKTLADVEQRLYPVDFGFPWQQRYIASISIPEGYAIEEMPKSTRIKSQDGSMVCSFLATTNEAKKINLQFSVSVKQTVYQPRDYAILRQMFQEIIDLQEATLVLKRAKK